jgi:hypothetical protein
MIGNFFLRATLTLAFLFAVHISAGSEENYQQNWAEAEFLDVIRTKVLRDFLLAILSHIFQRILLPTPPTEQKWFDTVCL